jgi:hypothetical protein
LISKENFQGRPHHLEAGSGPDGPPETEKAAGAGTPNGLKISCDCSVERTPLDTANERVGTEKNAADQQIAALFRAHRRVAEAIGATDDDDPDLIEAIAGIETALILAQPTTPADIYRRLLCLAPTLATDLTAPELAPLRDEIEALIGGEV